MQEWRAKIGAMKATALTVSVSLSHPSCISHRSTLRFLAPAMPYSVNLHIFLLLSTFSLLFLLPGLPFPDFSLQLNFIQPS